MKRKLLLLSLLSAAVFTAKAQDSTLTISGSVDTYFKYDFADRKNIGTSFATDHNSMSIGMVDIALKKKLQRASFVGEISFGPRGQEQSLPTGLNGDFYHIQNLYVSYDVTDKFALTAGYMGTFIGYEVISPVGNFNYSTSYLFTNGPFQNAGFKASYVVNDKVSLMAGIFNDVWNGYRSAKKLDNFGAQIGLTPVEGWSAYLNVLTGKTSGTIFDLTTAYQITDAFKLGLNAADWSAPESAGGYTGVALYPQIAVSSIATIGVRAEYFKWKGYTTMEEGVEVDVESQNVKAITLTANIKGGPLTFIPEVRLDSWNNDGNFLKKNGTPSKQASQFVLAAVYAF
ncbi:porin [Mucilaginibacter hurinus]|uniref:Porin n=1 Tax=Mucilaginibacter hurinus TaxID=2201324 RepID=A0A367GNM0_9SPHI|nr:porin [Mucilaginibacter hurinus]RCH55084.1 porin [Mucilaginibacter hurinus]